ncbi:glycosyltransferase [Marinomonas dokdonensis]|uniref:glycosyltransferase n=1 Tax=Marinomonas dokdonensis TaxID=328224 RepID=UPI004055542C
MKKDFKVSLIVAVYKRVDFLTLVSKSIEMQTFRNFEIIIAEDDRSPEVNDFVLDWKTKTSLSIKHINQDDDGFRKNKILNEALRVSSGEYTVFIDGDCILHKDFIKDHVKLSSPSVCNFGRRVMLTQKTTESLIETNDFKLLSLYRLILAKTRHLECAVHLPFLISHRKTGMLGCNFSVLRKNLIDINGFDEDFETPLFGEDTDIERRLRLNNIKLKCTKFHTIQYHLHHPLKDRSRAWEISGELYDQKVKEGKIICNNGYNKITD